MARLRQGTRVLVCIDVHSLKGLFPKLNKSIILSSFANREYKTPHLKANSPILNLSLHF